MAVRSAVYNQAKVRLQAAFGTGATVNTILNGLGFSMPKPVNRSGKMHTNSGEAFPSASVPSTKSHTEFTCESDILTFNSMVYPLITLFGNVPTNADGTNGKKRDFSLANGSIITHLPLTIEMGGSDRAKKVIDGFGKGLNIKITDKEAGFSMPFLGGKRQDDVTPTTNATGLTPAIVNPSAFDIYTATSAAGLDTNETTGASARFSLGWMVELNIPDIVGVIYRMNSGDTSFNTTVDLAAIPTLKITVGDDDADFGALIPYISSGATLFFRIVALGSAIAGMSASQERLAIDFAGKLVDPEDPGTEDGAVSNIFTFQGVHDVTWGKVLNLQFINTLAAITGA